jgi:uncharacterized RDD family membrane protein YckC
METALGQVCTSCGNTRLPYGGHCLFCGDLLSEPTAKVLVPSQAPNPLDKSAAVSPAATEYAGFWRRTGAGTIDVALEAAGALAVTVAIDAVLGRVGPMLGFEPWISKVATGMAYILVLTIGSWLYCAFEESSSRRATIGKRIMGLQVVTADGGRVSFGQATIRHFMKFLSLFSAGFGFMMAGWTKRRQALHDMPSDCIVIRVRPPRNLLLPSDGD